MIEENDPEAGSILGVSPLLIDEDLMTIPCISSSTGVL
jgi:hypothetical protein